MNKKNSNKESLKGIIIRLAEMGLEENEITYALDITERKLASMNLQEEIADILKNTLEARARKVEDALYRRAVGFEYVEMVNAETKPPSVPPLTKGGKSLTGTGGSLKSSAKSTIKTVIPDVTACIFWLKNKLPDKWRDPKDIASGKKSFQELIEAYDEQEAETE